MIPTLEQATAFAARITAAVTAWEVKAGPKAKEEADYFRERVASDLAGLRRHHAVLMYLDVLPEGRPFCATCDEDDDWPCPDARRYADGLRRTGALYRVTP